jgi:hypothetical protein
MLDLALFVLLADNIFTREVPESEGNNKITSLQDFLNDLPGPSSRLSEYQTGSPVIGQHFEVFISDQNITS